MRNILSLLLSIVVWCPTIFGQPTTIKTPTNVTINALIRSKMSPIDSTTVEADAADWLSDYNSSAVRVGPPTATYNCHDFAWHKKDGGNSVWLNAHSDFDDDPEELSPYWSGSAPTYVLTSP